MSPVNFQGDQNKDKLELELSTILQDKINQRGWVGTFEFLNLFYTNYDYCNNQLLLPCRELFEAEKNQFKPYSKYKELVFKMLYEISLCKGEHKKCPKAIARYLAGFGFPYPSEYRPY